MLFREKFVIVKYVVNIDRNNIGGFINLKKIWFGYDSDSLEFMWEFMECKMMIFFL